MPHEVACHHRSTVSKCFADTLFCCCLAIVMHRLHTAASGLLLSLCTVPWQALNRNPKQISGTSMSCTRRAYRIGNSWRLLEMVGHLIMFFKCFWGGGGVLPPAKTHASSLHLAGEGSAEASSGIQQDDEQNDDDFKFASLHRVGPQRPGKVDHF